MLNKERYITSLQCLVLHLVKYLCFVFYQNSICRPNGTAAYDVVGKDSKVQVNVVKVGVKVCILSLLELIYRMCCLTYTSIYLY